MAGMSTKEIIQKLNENFKLSITEISNNTGISQQALSKAEAGRKILPDAQRQSLKALFQEQEETFPQHRCKSSGTYADMFSSLISQQASFEDCAEEDCEENLEQSFSDEENSFTTEENPDSEHLAFDPELENESEYMYTPDEISKKLGIKADVVRSRVDKIRVMMGEAFFNENSLKAGNVCSVNSIIYEKIQDMGTGYSQEEILSELKLSSAEFNEILGRFSRKYKKTHVKNGQIDSEMFDAITSIAESKISVDADRLDEELAKNNTMRVTRPGYTYKDKVSFLLTVLGYSVKRATQEVSRSAPTLKSSSIRRYLRGQEIPESAEDVYLLAISSFFHVDAEWMIEDDSVKENEIKATFKDIGTAFFIIHDAEQAENGDFVYLSINGDSPALYRWHLNGIQATLEPSGAEETLHVNLCKDEVKLLGRAIQIKRTVIQDL